MLTYARVSIATPWFFVVPFLSAGLTFPVGTPGQRHAGAPSSLNMQNATGLGTEDTAVPACSVQSKPHECWGHPDCWNATRLLSIWPFRKALSILKSLQTYNVLINKTIDSNLQFLPWQFYNSWSSQESQPSEWLLFHGVQKMTIVFWGEEENSLRGQKTFPSNRPNRPAFTEHCPLSKRASPVKVCSRAWIALSQIPQVLSNQQFRVCDPQQSCPLHPSTSIQWQLTSTQHFLTLSALLEDAHHCSWQTRLEQREAYWSIQQSSELVPQAQDQSLQTLCSLNTQNVAEETAKTQTHWGSMWDWERMGKNQIWNRN